MMVKKIEGVTKNKKKKMMVAAPFFFGLMMKWKR